MASKEVTYLNQLGQGLPQGQATGQHRATTTTNTITISPSSVSGAPGDTETISVTSSPTGVTVSLSSNDFANTLFSPQSGDNAVHEYADTPEFDKVVYLLRRRFNRWCYSFRFSDRYGSNHSTGYPHCF